MTAGSVLCGFYGRSNLGDEAILAGLVDLLAEAMPGEAPLALTADPRGTRQDHGIETALYRAELHRAGGARRQLATMRSLMRRERFVLGGGDLLRDSPTQDVVGGWLMPLERAQSLRRRTAVIGISVGAIVRPESQRAIRRALDRTSFVVTRDVPSRDRLLALGVRTEVLVGPDLALRVFRPINRKTGSASVSGRPRVLVSVRGLADRADPASTQAHDHALAELAEVLDALVDRGADIVLVPLRSRPDRLQPVDDDYVASLELAHRAQRGHRFDVLRHVPTVGALREELAAADLVIGMRLHSVIMAVGLGVPCVALSYDSKVSGFCGEVGMADDCRESGELDADWLMSRAVAHLEGKAQAPTGLDDYRAREVAVLRAVRDW